MLRKGPCLDGIDSYQVLPLHSKEPHNMIIREEGEQCVRIVAVCIISDHMNSALNIYQELKI